jgi:N-acetylated-alpha-linked acidic dipeptidase
VVHLNVQMDASRRPIRDIVAKLPEKIRTAGWCSARITTPGRSAAWTPEAERRRLRNRAVACGAGEAGLDARPLHRLRFWDAEEPGLVGSTEYAEAFERELRQKAVAYINTDLFMQGHFFGGGTPSLRDFLVQVTKDVPALNGTGSCLRRMARRRVAEAARRARRKGPKDFEVELAALGSGADFVAFQDYLGLPTLSVQYDFEGSYGAYHSNYDSRYYVEHFSDPGFHVARTLAQVFGVTVMRLADAAVLPYRYSHYAHKISDFLDDAGTWAVTGEM